MKWHCVRSYIVQICADKTREETQGCFFMTEGVLNYFLKFSKSTLRSKPRVETAIGK